MKEQLISLRDNLGNVATKDLESKKEIMDFEIKIREYLEENKSVDKQMRQKNRASLDMINGRVYKSGKSYIINMDQSILMMLKNLEKYVNQVLYLKW